MLCFTGLVFLSLVFRCFSFVSPPCRPPSETLTDLLSGLLVFLSQGNVKCHKIVQFDFWAASGRKGYFSRAPNSSSTCLSCLPLFWYVVHGRYCIFERRGNERSTHALLSSSREKTWFSWFNSTGRGSLIEGGSERDVSRMWSNAWKRKEGVDLTSLTLLFACSMQEFQNQN